MTVKTYSESVGLLAAFLREHEMPTEVSAISLEQSMPSSPYGRPGMTR